MDGWCWQWMSALAAPGRGRPARNGCSATSTGGAGARADDPGLALLVRRRAGAGRTSWTAVLDVIRLGPADDATAVTAAQIREVVDRLIAAGQWRPGDPEILSWPTPAMTSHGWRSCWPICRWCCSDGCAVTGCCGCPAPPRLPGTERPPAQARRRVRPGTTRSPGRCRSTSPAPSTTRYGTARASSWDRLHPRLTHRTCWLEHDGELPVIDGTLIRLQVDHLPGDRHPKPVWLWCSATGATPAEVTHWWQAFLRRFDIETSKPQCCHSCGLSALSSVPSSAVLGFAS